MHQFYDYFHQNWRADHKNALKQYNQAAVAVIKTEPLCNIFFVLDQESAGSQSRST